MTICQEDIKYQKCETGKRASERRDIGKNSSTQLNGELIKESRELGEQKDWATHKSQMNKRMKYGLNSGYS